MSELSTVVLPQIDELISKYDTLKQQSKYDDLSDLGTVTTREFVVASLSVIQRASGSKREYTRQAQAVIQELTASNVSVAIPHLVGSLGALKHAIESGYLASVEEVIHGSLFADFLEMAEHILNDGYKDPAAVLIGGVLEEHLRKLCQRNGISTARTNSKGGRYPKKAETMNTDLAGQGILSKLDQKNVTAWLDLRNKAAHGHFHEYTTQQVELLLQCVRDFLVRRPV